MLSPLFVDERSGEVHPPLRHDLNRSASLHNWIYSILFHPRTTSQDVEVKSDSPREQVLALSLPRALTHGRGTEAGQPCPFAPEPAAREGTDESFGCL